MATHLAREQLIIQNEDSFVDRKRKRIYKGADPEVKKSKTHSAEPVLEGTSKPSKSTAERGGKGLPSPQRGNNNTIGTTLTVPDEASSKKSTLLEDALEYEIFKFERMEAEHDDEANPFSQWARKKDTDLPSPEAPKIKKNRYMYSPLRDYGELVDKWLSFI